MALNNIGNSLLRLGKTSEAVNHYRRAITINPKYAKPRAGLGRALVMLGRVEEGIKELKESLRLLPGFPTAHNNLGLALAQKGELKEAAGQFLKALKSDPAHAQARFNFAMSLIQVKRYGRAIKVLREGVRLTPEDRQTRSLLAWLLATTPRAEWRNGNEALDIAQKILAEDTTDLIALNSLAAAYAELGKFSSAVGAARQALRRAETAGMQDEAKRIREYMRLYQGSRPYRSP
jgi:Flp pilus assembly protein TadD